MFGPERIKSSERGIQGGGEGDTPHREGVGSQYRDHECAKGRTFFAHGFMTQTALEATVTRSKRLLASSTARDTSKSGLW